MTLRKAVSWLGLVIPPSTVYSEMYECKYGCRYGCMDGYGGHGGRRRDCVPSTITAAGLCREDRRGIRHTRVPLCARRWKVAGGRCGVFGLAGDGDGVRWHVITEAAVEMHVMSGDVGDLELRPAEMEGGS
ncbi:hypothetical protein EDC01DRAFT_386908 [Geopyxis carbonaria]|nr:hypothetical protein EDC01DRAFT_386908 [Geopyxis carbonaria]